MAATGIPCQTVLGILLTVLVMGGGTTLPSSVPRRWREVIHKQTTSGLSNVEHHGASHELLFLAEPNQPVHLFDGEMMDSSHYALDSTWEQILAQRYRPLRAERDPPQPMADIRVDPPQRIPHLALVAIGAILLVVTLVGLSSAASRMK